MQPASHQDGPQQLQQPGVLQEAGEVVQRVVGHQRQQREARRGAVPVQQQLQPLQDGTMQALRGERHLQVRRQVPVRARHEGAAEHGPPPEVQNRTVQDLPQHRPLPVRPPLPLHPQQRADQEDPAQQPHRTPELLDKTEGPVQHRVRRRRVPGLQQRGHAHWHQELRRHLPAEPGVSWERVLPPGQLPEVQRLPHLRLQGGYL